MAEEVMLARNPEGYDPIFRFYNRRQMARQHANYLFGSGFDPEFKRPFNGAVPLYLTDGSVLYIDLRWIGENPGKTELYWDATWEEVTYLLWSLLEILFPRLFLAQEEFVGLFLTHEEFEGLFRTIRRNNLLRMVKIADLFIFELIQRNRLELAVEFGLEQAWTTILFREYLGKCWPETEVLGLPCPELPEPRLSPRQPLPQPSSPPELPHL